MESASPSPVASQTSRSGTRGFKAGGYRRRAAVNGVEAEGVHVIRKAAGAADAADHHEIFAGDAQFRKDGLNRGEDGVIAAARAPADFLVGLKIFFGQRDDGRKSGGAHETFSAAAQHLFDFLFELGLFEGAALNFVEAHGVHQIFRAQNPEQLAHVQFRNQHLLVALDDFAEI